MSGRFTRFKGDVSTEVSKRGWFVSWGLLPLLVALLVFAAIGGAPLLLAVDGWRAVYPRWGDVVLVGLAIAALMDAVLIVGALTQRRMWRRRSKAANLEAERWNAFRRYLTDFPRLQEAPPATLELWERFLVYGIAFGIAERVLQAAHIAMPEALAQASRSTGSRRAAISARARARSRSATSRRGSAPRSRRRRPARAGAAAASRAAEAVAAEAGAAAPGKPCGTCPAGHAHRHDRAAVRNGHLLLHRHGRLDRDAPGARDGGYAEELAAHRRIVREACSGAGGVEVDIRAMRSSSPSSARPTRCCGAGVQDGLADGRTRVRIGLHTGEPLVTADGFYVGMDVHRAARIAAAGHGGQVLVSEVTRELVPDVEFLDLGEQRLKDLTRPELVDRSGRVRSLSRCSPRSRNSTSGTSSRVTCETSTCPPCPEAAMRAARCTSMPT